MGLPGFFYNDLGEGAAVRSSKQGDPICAFMTKAGSGSASMNAAIAAPGGVTYSERDYEDEEYIVQVNGVSAGKETGQATFRWRRASDATWQASGVATSSGAKALDDGVTVTFTGGTGNDFEANDEWRFRVVHFRGKNRPFDRDPNTCWRTGPAGTAAAYRQYLSLDLGASLDLDAIILKDHNLTSAATVTLKGYAGADPNPFLDDFQVLPVQADGAAYDDKTHQLAFPEGSSAAFIPGTASTHYSFLARRAAFTTITVDITVAPVFTGAGGMNLVVEYWNGAAWAAVANLVDNTASGGDTFQKDGTITFNSPAGWTAGGTLPAGLAGIADTGFYFLRISVAPTVDKAVTSRGTAQQVAPYAIGAAAWTETLAWASGTILKRTAATRTARSVRLEIDDGANTAGYFQIHNIFIGEETILSSADYLSRGMDDFAAAEEEQILSGVEHDTLYNTGRRVEGRFLLGNADKNTLLSILGDLHDPAAGAYKPFFFDLDRDNPDVILGALAGDLRTPTELGTGSTALWDVAVRIEEIVKGRVA